MMQRIFNPVKVLFGLFFENQKIKEKEIDIADIYTTLPEAKAEIQRRWGDKDLRKKVERFLEGNIPECLKDGPKATLVRYISTPNNELFYFLDLANMIDLDFALMEFSNDKFVAKNPDKYNLCKTFFYNGIGKKGGFKIENICIVDFNKNEGKMLDQIRTVWGEKLIDFHHKILGKAVSGSESKIFNISDWFKDSRNKSKDYYYLYYLALFICHGVLFENFLLDKGESEFTRKKVLPSFKKLEKIFGVKPLIVPLEPLNDEKDCAWRHYSNDVKNIFDQEGLINMKK